MEENFSEQRKNVKNRRINYSIAEKNVVIKEYKKTGKLKETAQKFDISPGFFQDGWLIWNQLNLII